MLNESILSQLRDMKLDGMVGELTAQFEDPAKVAHLSFEERVNLLVSAEWSRRKSNRINRYIARARFSAPSATVDGIEYLPDRELDRAQIMNFATCRFVHEGHHIVIKGATGSGKTYLACAIGNAACRRDMSVRYMRLPELLDELQIAKDDGLFKKAVANYKRVKLLILDEWLLRPLTAQEAYNLLEIIEARCEHGSMIFCTQYTTEEWYKRISPGAQDGSPISEAIMDRIVHRSYLVDMKGTVSMRQRHGLQYPSPEEQRNAQT